MAPFAKISDSPKVPLALALVSAFVVERPASGVEL